MKTKSIFKQVLSFFLAVSLTQAPTFATAATNYIFVKNLSTKKIMNTNMKARKYPSSKSTDHRKFRFVYRKRDSLNQQTDQQDVAHSAPFAHQKFQIALTRSSPPAEHKRNTKGKHLNPRARKHLIKTAVGKVLEVACNTCDSPTETPTPHPTDEWIIFNSGRQRSAVDSCSPFSAPKTQTPPAKTSAKKIESSTERKPCLEEL